MTAACIQSSDCLDSRPESITEIEGTSHSWLTISGSSSTSIAAESPEDITLDLDPSGLSAGTYFSDIAITSDSVTSNILVQFTVL